MLIAVFILGYIVFCHKNTKWYIVTGRFIKFVCCSRLGLTMSTKKYRGRKLSVANNKIVHEDHDR